MTAAAESCAPLSAARRGKVAHQSGRVQVWRAHHFELSRIRSKMPTHLTVPSTKWCTTKMVSRFHLKHKALHTPDNKLTPMPLTDKVIISREMESEREQINRLASGRAKVGALTSLCYGCAP